MSSLGIAFIPIKHSSHYKLTEILVLDMDVEEILKLEYGTFCGGDLIGFNDDPECLAAFEHLALERSFLF